MNILVLYFVGLTVDVLDFYHLCVFATRLPSIPSDLGGRKDTIVCGGHNTTPTDQDKVRTMFIK